MHSDVLRIGVTGPPLLLTEANRDLQYAGLQENKELQVSGKTQTVWNKKNLIL